MEAAKWAPDSKPDSFWQPVIGVTAAPLGNGTPTRGSVMIDTGASITLVTKRWADAHGLKVAPTDELRITGANGQPVDMVGTCSVTL